MFLSFVIGCVILFILWQLQIRYICHIFNDRPRILDRLNSIEFDVNHLSSRIDGLQRRIKEIECDTHTDVKSNGSTMGFGKYAHLCPEDVIKQDINYARWVCSITSNNINIQSAQCTLSKLLPIVDRPKNGSSCLKFVEWLAATKPKPIQDYLNEVSKIEPCQVSNSIKIDNISDPMAFGKYVDAKLKCMSTDSKYNIDLFPALTFIESSAIHSCFRSGNVTLEDVKVYTESSALYSHLISKRVIRHDVKVYIRHGDKLIMKGIADMIIDNVIWEFKTGNNSFCSYSWIQVLLYAIGLNLNQVKIYNPISGLLSSYTIESNIISDVKNILYV